MIHRYPLLAIALISGLMAIAQTAVFTESGTFVVPAGVTSITVELIGAGGNGASNGGGGGGGGAYVRGTSSVTPGQNISFVVGTGGSGLATIAGGLSMLANAGANGSTVANPNLGGGGAGGTTLGGQVSHPGGAGGGGYWTYFGGGGGGAAGPMGAGGPGGNTIVYNGTNCLTPGGAGGSSGGGMAGAGGKGAGFTDNACTATNPAADGAGFGAGGGGGNGVGSATGTGGGGLVVVTWSGGTGIAEVNATVPEPVSLMFTDHIALRGANSAPHCALYDALGRSIWSGTRIDQQDLSALPVGTYLLHVRNNGEERVFRMVKALER